MYNYKNIEKKWAEKWVKDKTFTPDLEKAKDPYYALFMFPYPSAEGLHIGNFYAFTCVDVMAKYKKLQGKDVFEPIGFDAFGMHSENYALKIKETPRKMLNRTMANFRKQLSSAGLGCDWTREIDTTSPEYYKWTQWIFTKLFEKGLAYQKEALLNWCPSCKTVLADEQIENGVCERCKTAPEKKTMKQWFLKITAYAQRLLDGLDDMDWSDITKNAQRNWIGRSEGAMVKFQISNSKSQTNSKSQITNDQKMEVEVFTTRPDTLFGATYFVLSPEHPLVKKITSPKQKKEVEEYIKKTGAKSDLERAEAKGKTGVFTGAYAINPVNNEKIPVWIADYVLMGYGTGAIMAVPAHDERDFEFAKKYNLPIKEVVIPIFGKKHKNEKYRETITALVHRKKDNKFLYLNDNHYKIVVPIIGGIKKYESIKDTAEREVYEETGYKVKFVRKLGCQIESHFFASHKNVWRHRLDQPVLCELLDEDAEPDEISEKEKNKHKIIWLTAQEALKRVAHEDNKVGLLRYLGEYGVFCGEGRNINSDFPAAILSNTKTPEKNSEAFGGHEDCYPRRGSGTRHSINSIAYNNKGVKNKIIGIGALLEIKHGIFLFQKRDLKTNRNTGMITPFGGGINKNETTIDALKREVKEELNFDISGKRIKSIGFFESHIERNKFIEMFYIKDIPDDKLNIQEGEAIIKCSLSEALQNEQVTDFTKEVICYFKQNKNITKSLNGLTTKEAKKAIIKWLKERGAGRRTVNYKLRDWCISRQRYWGPPVPIVYCKKCGVQSVREKNLPVELSEMEKGWEPAGDGRGPLAKVKSFMKTTCPKCNGPAEREPDVMDNFLDSAWYFFRYISPYDEGQPFDKLMARKWLPVDFYVGGNEHAVLHLMYTRFITMALHDLGLIDFDNPFKKFRANGMILKDGKKMSKSKGNIVHPEEYGDKIGYDALKTYILFLGPLSEDRSFSDSGAQGAKRWIERIARLKEKVNNNCEDSVNTIKKLHQTIKIVTSDFEDQKYNTAIARLMELTNTLSAEKNISNKTWKKFLILVAPFAPALTEELWTKLGNKKNIFTASWPKYDPKLIKDDIINLVIQINGKLRDTIEAPADISEDKAKKIALESEKIKKWVEGKDVVKVIFVNGKLVNIVIK